MKIVFFSLALISAASLVSNGTCVVNNPADRVRQACSIVSTRCEICGKEVHDESVDGQEENSEIKCGCGKINKQGCPICPRCEICGKEVHDEAAEIAEDQEATANVKCGCGKPKPKTN